MHVKKNDNVYILAGKDKGKTGKILRALPRDNKVIVEGINLRKVHQKPKNRSEKGKTIERTFPIHVSNVRLSEKKTKAPKAEKKVKAKTTKK